MNITSQTYTKTWGCTFTQTYREKGTKRTDYRSQKICQGRYVYEPWGIMRSLIGFDDGARIRNELQGARIDKVELYLQNEHWYYYAGGTVVAGFHNHSWKPDTFSHSEYGKAYQKFYDRGTAGWVNLPVALGYGIRDGYYKGVSIFANTGAGEYYGIFNGYGDWGAPQLKITYTK
ncbi:MULTISPECIES: hypothetical protein [Bacillus]|uniref:hypothetical protein n=1 Tax=Bacillus TaxID=1386 RepID=UPI0020A1163D|nr:MULTISPECIES: hypothetical protein [Bacillus]MCP1324283.1 hypothetical protein [Bacillus sp. S0628]